MVQKGWTGISAETLGVPTLVEPHSTPGAPRVWRPLLAALPLAAHRLAGAGHGRHADPWAGAGC